MKRVLCLYRVSTLKQVDKKDDIPMQRRECREFIERMDDWVFYRRVQGAEEALSAVRRIARHGDGFAVAFE